MAGKEIRYEIDVNASDAKRGLTEFSRAAQRAGKEAAKGLEDTATAGDKARTAIKAMADAFDTELRGAAAAAEALGQALGPELTGRMDVNQVVTDLNRMGVSFDDIRADADKFAATLKEVDGIRLAQVNAGLGDLDDKMRNVGGTATNAKGALANMVGNTAQDISGLSNSLGVAIGQMAEYSADALLAGANTKQAFREMAIIAAPVAALAGLQMGISAVSGSIKDWRASQEAFLQQQRDFNEAVRSSGSQLEAINEIIEDNVLISGTPEMTGMQSLLNDLPVLGRMLDDTAEATDTVATSLAAAGISQEEWFEAMRVDIPGGLARYNALNDKLLQLKDSGAITGDQFELLSEQFARQGQIVATNAVQTANAADVTRVSFDGMNDAMAEQGRQVGIVDAAWATLVQEMADGHSQSQNAIDAWNTLQQTLGLSNDEIAEMVDQKVAEKLEADAAAAREFAAAIADASEALGEIDVDDIENIGAALQSAFDAGDVTIDFQTVKEDLRGAFAELGTFLEENPVDIDWSKVLDTSADTGLSSELLGMIAGIRDQFQEGITSAFEIAGPSAAQHFANTFLPQLRLMGMTQAQAMEFLGLPPNGNVDVILQPLIDAEAKADALANLNSLTGVDPNNPIIAYVTAALQTGAMDPVIGEIMSLLIAQQYGIPVEPQLAGFAPEQVEAAQIQLAAVGEEPVTVSMLVDDDGTVDDFTDAADEAAEERNPQFVVPKSDSLGKMEDLLNAVARQREVQFVARSDNAGAINELLNYVARFREQHTYATVDARNAFHTLDMLDEPRTVHVHVVTHQHGGIPANASPGTASVSASTRGATPAATSSVVAPTTININAAVIGNRYDVERVVSGAVRNSIRLAGRRRLAVAS